MARADYDAGLIGKMPDWASLTLAARWLKTSPWELMAQDEPDFWMEVASVLSNAEHDSMMKKTGKN